MRYFPVFLDLTGRQCLVVGATEEARHKAEALRSAGAVVRSVAMLGAGAVERLQDLALAVVATGDADTDIAASRLLRSLGMPLNVVDSPELCTFIWPAIVDRDPVTIAISTAGTAPMLAGIIRKRIEWAVPAAFGMLAALAGSMRLIVRSRLPDAARRQRFWQQAFAGRVAQLVFAGDIPEAAAALHRALPSQPTVGSSTTGLNSRWRSTTAQA
jgi:uroporphyrin-III C-methyltransferase/precorrin-2 dehydrogenase/sirohydrochlorin ferrochelatase